MIFLAPLALAVQGAMADAPNIEVTVYNQNFALIKEVREVTLPDGIGEITVEDVAANIDPTSVHFKSLDDPAGVEILEQNYKYDLLSPFAVMAKSVGKKVRLHRVLPDGKKEIVEGVLLAAPTAAQQQTYDPETGAYIQPTPQGVVVRSDDGRILLEPSGEVEVLEIPEGLISRPTLFWQVRSDKAGPQRAELSYITDNVNWSADYVATVNKDDNGLDLGGWVTLTNNSGKAYKEARLKLVAGDVRRIKPRYTMAAEAPAADEMYDSSRNRPQFVESGLFEYHLYTLGRKTTVADREVKQLSLLSATGVPATKKMVFEGQRTFWRNYGENYRPGKGSDTDSNQKVNVVLEIKNSKDNHLGMPLPKGKMRVYKRDNDGQLQFVGEDEIDHTPKDETIRLYIGNAFDVVATRKRTDFKVISPNVIEQAVEIEVRNH
jgi:hypothetical protein